MRPHAHFENNEKLVLALIHKELLQTDTEPFLCHVLMCSLKNEHVFVSCNLTMFQYLIQYTWLLAHYIKRGIWADRRSGVSFCEQSGSMQTQRKKHSRCWNQCDLIRSFVTLQLWRALRSLHCILWIPSKIVHILSSSRVKQDVQLCYF